jgi:hypothetical protein
LYTYRAEDRRLTRARDDLTLAPNARHASLWWNGREGALAFVTPRVLVQVDPHQRPRRRVTVGVPASTVDPLGPTSSGGGEVKFLRLDDQGAAVGDARTLFHENARLWRAALTRDADGWAVAWTGTLVTDDEARGTIRAMRLDARGEPLHTMAAATNFSGDPGDVLRVVRAGGSTAVVFSGSRCAAREGVAPLPPSLNPDPSTRIDAPTRSPQPQAPPRRAPGPPIECAPNALHFATVRDDGSLGPVVAGPSLRADTAAIADHALIAPVFSSTGPAIARIELVAYGFGAVTAWDTQRPLTPIAPAAPTPQPIDNLTRPSPDVEVPQRIAVVPPPEMPTAATLDTHLATPRAFAASPGDRGAPLAVITDDRRAVALVRQNHASLVATTASFLYEVDVLPGNGSTWMLTREGTWSGPVRFTLLDGTPPTAPMAWPFVRAAPPPPLLRPVRFETRAPLRYDEDFSRLFAVTRQARAVFMRHENIAGMMAARPQAPTDPRMPGLIAVRRRHRNRWEAACSQLRARALVLARGGAGDDVLSAASQVCEIPGELRLGVPIDPAL